MKERVWKSSILPQEAQVLLKLSIINFPLLPTVWDGTPLVIVLSSNTDLFEYDSNYPYCLDINLVFVMEHKGMKKIASISSNPFRLLEFL